jgi:hypothetical protein
MKLAWRCSQHFGGLSNIGFGASANAMSAVADAPPRTQPGVNMTLPKSSAAFFTAGSLNGISCLYHLS